MADTATQPWPTLAPEQQRLLLAALSSNKRQAGASPPATSSQQLNPASLSSDNTMAAASEGVNPSSLLNTDPVNAFSSSTDPLSSYDFNSSDAALDFDYSGDFGALGSDTLSGISPPGDFDLEQGEKRKSPEDEDDDDSQEEGDAKRRDTDDKGAKKPGRKPLTSEPTTKRKAQNRAAQRAFRERKEKHLKDLETKVTDLEKASESANHENGILRAQVERLQGELKEYRKRLSLASNGVGASPPTTSPVYNRNPQTGRSSIDFDFDFDFPHFGGLPGSQMPRSSSNPSGLTAHHNSFSSNNSYNSSSQNEVSPQTSRSMSNGTLQRNTSNAGAGAGNMFMGGFFEAMDNNSTYGFKKNATARSMSDNRSSSEPFSQKYPSPSGSGSSISQSPPQLQASSSCCTSPDTIDNWATNFNTMDGKSANIHTGSTSGNNSVPNTTPGLTNAKTPNSEVANFDWLASQNGGQFDPVLFGDYRESQDAVVGGGDFSGGFFEDSLTFPDFNDPFNFNMSADTTIPAKIPSPEAPKKKMNLMEQVAKQRDGGDEYDDNLVMPGENGAPKTPEVNMMTCHKIWNQLQNCPKFKSGDFDVDSLCKELSSKAKCTETGVAVPKEYVEAALWKLAKGPGEGASAGLPSTNA